MAAQAGRFEQRLHVEGEVDFVSGEKRAGGRAKYDGRSGGNQCFHVYRKVRGSLTAGE
jgi:hypothetical protein